MTSLLSQALVPAAYQDMVILERHFKPDYLDKECGRSCLFVRMTRELVALPLAQCKTHLSGPKLNRFFRTAELRRDLKSG